MGLRDVLCTGCGSRRDGTLVTTTHGEEREPWYASIASVVLHPLVVAIWGTVLVVVAGVLVSGNADATRWYIALTVLTGVGFSLYIMYVGWQEGGLIGAYWSHKYPLGGILGDVSGRRLAAVWLLIVASVIAGTLWAQTPEAWPTPKSQGPMSPR